MIEHQILITNLQGNVQQQGGRINSQILGVIGVKHVVPIIIRTTCLVKINCLYD